MRDGVRSDQELEAMEVRCHDRGSRRLRARAELISNPLAPILDCRQKVGPGAHCRVENCDAVVSEAERLVEAAAQQVGNQRCLGVDD